MAIRLRSQFSYINMKRKRKTKSAERSNKRPKVEQGSALQATIPLLQQYYPQVLPLRQYLATKLSKASKKRRRKLLQYGLQGTGDDEASAEPELTRLLETTIVGTSKPVHTTDFESIDRDITVFTQQLSDSTITVSPTQGALKQSEVGRYINIRSVLTFSFNTHMTTCTTTDHRYLGTGRGLRDMDAIQKASW